MRTHILALSASAVLFGLLLAGNGYSQDEPAGVPPSLSSIPDSLLRDALGQYAPDYDSLPPDAQLAVYANICRVLNRPGPAVPPPEQTGRLRGFTPARPYDPKIDVPVEKYLENPLKYNRYWDAEKDGGTGIYEPWRDPMWTPREEFGVF